MCIYDMAHIQIYIATHHNILWIYVFLPRVECYFMLSSIKSKRTRPTWASLTYNHLALLTQHSANALSKWVLDCTVLSWICLFCCGLCFCHLFCVWGNSLTQDQQVIVLNLTQRIKEKVSCETLRFKFYSISRAFKGMVEVKTILRPGWSPLTLQLLI